jgi:hypothetical protein
MYPIDTCSSRVRLRTDIASVAEATYSAHKRYQVMLAQAEDVNVSHNDHFFVVFCKDGFSDDLCMEYSSLARSKAFLAYQTASLRNLSSSTVMLSHIFPASSGVLACPGLPLYTRGPSEWHLPYAVLETWLLSLSS